MNLLDFLQEHNVEYREAGDSPHVSQGWIGVICPWCGIGTDKYGLGIHTESLSATCWKCGKHSIVEVLKELTGEPWHVCRDFTRGFGRLPVQQSQDRGRYCIPGGVGPLLEPHKAYLRSRRFDPEEIIRLWSVGGIGLHSRLPWRLFIPVVGRDGRPLSWTTRALAARGTEGDNGYLRYVNAKPEEEAISIKSLLYGEQLATHAIIVVEGPTDVWRIGPGAVATFGLTVTAAQKAEIARYPLRAICFDNEPEAQRRATELCNELSTLPGKTVRVEVDAKDPGEASESEVKLLRRTFLE